MYSVVAVLSVVGRRRDTTPRTRGAAGVIPPR